MTADSPEKLNVLVAYRAREPYLERIRAVDPQRLNVVYIWPHLLAGMEGSWPPRWLGRFNEERPAEPMPTDELEALLRSADVMLLGNPYPRDLAPRLANLKWAHFNFAGVSNLADSSWWGTSFTSTSSRGYVSARPIAESVIAAVMMMARRLDLAARNTGPGFDMDLDPPVITVAGKTMGVIGLGGIGRQVAEMARGLGMRVIATRNSVSSVQRDVDGVDEVYPPSLTHDVLAQSDFIAVCAMWTPETDGMFDAAAFAATKPGAVFINVARGGLVRDEALVEALRSGHLRGAYLDVWPDDHGTPPSDDLLRLPNVVITPHISNRGDQQQNLGLELFLDNLQRFLKGEELINVIDWARGY